MSEETRGGMDIRMQRGMWHNFTRLVKWSIIGVTLLLILMAIFLV